MPLLLLPGLVRVEQVFPFFFCYFGLVTCCFSFCLFFILNAARAASSYIIWILCHYTIFILFGSITHTSATFFFYFNSFFFWVLFHQVSLSLSSSSVLYFQVAVGFFPLFIYFFLRWPFSSRFAIFLFFPYFRFCLSVNWRLRFAPVSPHFPLSSFFFSLIFSLWLASSSSSLWKGW